MTFRKCAVCDNESRAHPKKTCSDECSAEAMRAKSRRHYHRNANPAPLLPPMDCHMCGTSFTPRIKTARYCSDACRGKSQIAARTAIKGPRCCYKCGVGVEVQKNTPGRVVCEGCRATPNRANQRERDRARTLRRYGITQADYDRMLALQGGRCAICATDDPGKKSWCIDHDHDTEAVRGLLCSLCNTGIGNLRDDPDILKSAVSYLERHKRLADAVLEADTGPLRTLPNA